MGTPFISFLEPSKLEGYKTGAPHEAQPLSIPRVFIEAMEIRHDVFVVEQGLPVKGEFDLDDPRCCHWVSYASVHETIKAEVRDDIGNIVQPRKGSTHTLPIGTIRLVPFPHRQHPKPGGRYWNGVLEGAEKDEAEPQTETDLKRPFITDRRTTFHDGKESYVKLDRLAVRKDYRGNSLAGLLVNTVLTWLVENSSYFDPSIAEIGLEQMGASRETDIPSWDGLVYVHAQERVKSAWETWGFQVDEGMGTWWEEGIPYVGMAKRVDVGTKQMHIY